MIQVKCINKIRDKQNIIQYYTLIDSQGNQKTVTADALKMVIRNNQLECINLTLTSDNRLIDKKIEVRQQINTTKTTKTKRINPVESYKAYVNKMRMLGQRINAIYKIDGNEVTLQEVLVKEGVFIILPFVTKLGIIDDEGHIISAFKDCIDIKVINKSNITNMGRMFYGCKGLQRLDLSSFDTSKVTNMSGIFENCENLQELHINNFDTSKVTDMNKMFYHCYKLQKLDLSSFNTSKVTNMENMFVRCENLESLDLSSFSTSQEIDMHGMFYGCKNLKNLDLSNFDTSQVTDIHGIFNY